MRAKDVTLAGWGRALRAETRALRPERLAEAARAVAAAEPGPGLIAYGAGRSYGDIALNSGGTTLLTGRLDRLVDFSPEDGLVVCEPGVSYRDLLRIFLPRGFLAPASPGTAFATVGGAIANDVHGKNHDSAGSFGDHVAWLDLAIPDGRVLRVSPQEDAELFAATIGGAGLTGVILRAAIRMARVPSARVAVRERRMPDIGAFMAALQEARGRSTYSVGWIDALSGGTALGRGVLQTAEYAEGGLEAPPPGRTLRLPADLPGFVLNRHSIGLFNRLYHRRVPEAGRERIVPLETFLYPLDAILDWNRMYGRSGFHQFQCVIPDAAAERGIPALLEAIAREGSASFLAVLKTLGGEGRGHLSFPMRGFTLALDFPLRAGTAALMARLEAITLDHGGRIYLAKDACLTAEGFRRMYPRLDAFRAVLDRIDPQRRMRSDLSRRLNIHGDS
ncbi:MAG TPA: FAD-binding oxidoreductase [Alphaproteobacteria bacterium]|nr:FAD-binding oxidoreductase [Alphaproteobacteria bacterium]